MNLTFVNKFAICNNYEPDNREMMDVILEFFVEEPIFNPKASSSEPAIQGSAVNSVAKIIMAKGCAKNLYDALGELLENK